MLHLIKRQVKYKDVFKGTICKTYGLKYPKTTRTMLYILLTCVVTLFQMFPRMFKSREISNFNQDTDRVHASPINDIIPALPSISSFTFVEIKETPKLI